MDTAKGRTRSLSIPLEGSWTAIPNDMLRDTELSTNERLLAALLRVYAGLDVKAFPRQDELARLMGCDRRSIQRWLRRLHARGYLVQARTMWGNTYTLVEPRGHSNGVLTDATLVSPHAIPESHAHVTPGSPQATPESHATYHDLDSIDLDSSSSEGDDDSGITTRGKGDPRTGRLLRSVGIGAWRKLQRELAHIPHELVERRVNFLLDHGKEPGVIVHSLRELPFTGDMDEQGPQPSLSSSSEFRDVFNRGGDTPAGDDQVQQLERSDPDLADFFRECDL